MKAYTLFSDVNNVMGIYQNIYALLEQYIYGGTLTADAELVCTLASTAGCLFLVSLPFLVVWKVIKLIVG